MRINNFSLIINRSYNVFRFLELVFVCLIVYYRIFVIEIRDYYFNLFTIDKILKISEILETWRDELR